MGRSALAESVAAESNRVHLNVLEACLAEPATLAFRARVANNLPDA